MDKRTFVALFVVVVLFFVWSTYFSPKPQPQPAPAEQAAPADSVAADSIQAPAAVQTPTALPDSLTLGADSLKTLSLANGNFTVSLSNRGASISSIELKKYTWTDKATPVELVPEGQNLAGITLLNHKAAAPLDLKNVIWQSAQSDTAGIVFWLGEASAPLVTKSYRLDDKYGILMDVAVNSPEPVYGIEYDFSAGLADSEEIKPRLKDTDYKLLLFSENAPEKLSLAKIKKESPQGPISSFKWAALRSKYFTIAIQETGNPLTSNYYSEANPETGNPSIVLDSRDRSPSQLWEQNFLIYAGPADYDLMRSYPDSKLELIPERGPGWLRWLANAIAWLLKFLHSFIPNYGVVIIIFSLILKLVLHPLTKKSMDANLKMQRIQPQVQEIQTKYKSNPQLMQQELSKLYKEAGASPMSGCLPLLLQMPIFIALYNVLRYALEMRNARFLGWLNLSEPDPYLILPIIMAIFMILQSLMTRPSKDALAKMDEKQQAMQQSTRLMTWIMPIMLFFIFRGLPSGLVLYYTVFNILSVAHQYYTQKRLKQKETTL
ncbi:MAG: membrane protein insertase YidC [Candidatus Cloacimonetes bacterium]|nr:membrane protein insertase YidC [Candidatus Cloacimonadota bacterium]